MDIDRDTWEGSLPVTPHDMRSLHDAIASLDRQMLGPAFGKFTLTPAQYHSLMEITGLTDEQLFARGIVCVHE